MVVSICTDLNRVIAGDYSAVLDLDVSGRMCELALVVRSGALLSLVFATDFELEPTRVLNVGQSVDHCHSIRKRRPKYSSNNGHNSDHNCTDE